MNTSECTFVYTCVTARRDGAGTQRLAHVERYAGDNDVSHTAAACMHTRVVVVVASPYPLDKDRRLSIAGVLCGV